MTDKRSSRWPPLVALLCVLAVAAGLRLALLPGLPLGLHYDEAANGILAAEIARGAKFPVFISSYTGKEVLFFYWVGAWMRVLGESVLALRLTSAIIGICTVGATAWSVYELFHHRRDRLWVGIIAASFLATSFWHLVLSRLGFRAITQPLLQALTVGALWRGLRLERRGWLALAGFLGGATLYTYLAARAFPLVIGAGLLTLLIVDRHRFRARLGQMALFALVAAATVAPLAAYFAAHPAALTTRMGQVASGSWSEAWSGIRACLGMFFLRGDPYIRFNLPHRPLFDPVTGSLFLLGVLVTLINSRPKHQNSSLPAASRAFLLFLLPIMILPSALATGEITPSNLRAVGLLPFVYAFPALAIATLLRLAIRNSQSAIRNPQLALLTLLLLALTTPLTARLYFHDWASSPALYEAADGDLVDAAAYLNQSDLTAVTPYVASIHYRHPTLAFLAKEYAAVRWLTGGRTVVFPAAGSGLLILPRSADGDREWIEERLGEDACLPTPTGPDGHPAFHAYRVPANAAPTPAHTVRADFGHVATLLGYDLMGTARSGEELDVILTWRVEATLPDDTLPALRLTDTWGNAWGETRPFHYPAEQWTPGEVVLDHISLPVAPGAPPGRYRLGLAFYAASSTTYLPLLDPAGAYAGIDVGLPVTLELATTPPSPADLGIGHRLDRATDAGLTLLGANLDTTTVRPGEPVRLTLFWQADRAPETDLTVRLELDQTTLYQGAPVHDTYPTSHWSAGEVVVDRYTPRLERETEPGTYSLILSLSDAEGNLALEPLDLGEVRVEATERTFGPVQMDHTVEVTLGDEVELLGYDISPAEPSPGDQVTITLAWQAMKEMRSSYTVFIHLLGADAAVVAQHDGVPVGGTYPTSLWVPEEVVLDPHVLELPADLPPGQYDLEVGMYIIESGVRLAAEGSPDGAVHLILTLPTPEQ